MLATRRWLPSPAARAEGGGRRVAGSLGAGALGAPAAYDARVMARLAPLVALGYGKYVRADRVYALVPLEGPERGDGRRTQVYVEGIEGPLVASRSDGAIAHDVDVALGRGVQRGHRGGSAEQSGQDPLFYS